MPAVTVENPLTLPRVPLTDPAIDRDRPVLWVNLPKAMKFATPRYQDIRASEVSLIASADGGVLLRVIAGTVAGHPGPGITHTPIALVHATLSPGASLTLPWQPEYNALVYTLAGRGSVGVGRQPIAMGQLAVFG